jgi:N-acetylglucosamine kinase-like BadF-type ATPase
LSTPGLLLGVDGGGTKTEALVADLDGRVLARGRGPAGNLHNGGIGRLGESLSAAVEGALGELPGPLRPAGGGGALWRSARIAAACFGLAGIDSAADEAEVSSWIRERGAAARFTVVNDAELVLAAGTPAGWGLALVSGTGSVCLGRSRDGRTARAGGWGPLLGDEGSAYHVAIEALRLAARTADGRAAAHGLLGAALAHWGLKDAAVLVRRVHAAGAAPAEIAGLAPRVLELATQGDPGARGVVEGAAWELAVLVRTVVRRLGLERPPLALAGGLLRTALRPALAAVLGDEVGAGAYVTEPAGGAIVLAQRLLAS